MVVHASNSALWQTEQGGLHIEAQSRQFNETLYQKVDIGNAKALDSILSTTLP